MRADKVVEVHAIKLISGQDQNVAAVITLQVGQVLADGVGGATIPVGCFVGLLRRPDLDITLAEGIELVGLTDVTMEADAEVLGEDVDALDAAVDAVGNGDIDEAILAGDGYGRFASLHGQWIKAGSAPAAEYQADHVLHGPSPCEPDYRDRLMLT